MKYRFECKVTPLDMWKLSMNHTYRSIAGVCNVIFTVAMVLLTGKYWSVASDLGQIVLLTGCLLFPVIQPIAIFLKARGQVSGVPQDLQLEFDGYGVHVTTGNQNVAISWNKMRGITKEPNMLILMSEGKHGYMLTNRVLGKDKNEFYEFAKKQMIERK